MATDRMNGSPTEAWLELQGKRVTRSIVPVVGSTILELADRNRVDWQSHCQRGTCARCRCQVLEGGDRLAEPTSAELARLTPEELERGYRLGCQVRIASAGKIVVKHAPYF